MSECQSDYLSAALSFPNTVADTVIEILNNNKIDFDGIAFSGFSGSLIAPLVAAKMNKSLLLIRKESDKSHSFRRIEGSLDVKRVVIIDDLIVEGKTIDFIVNTLKHSDFWAGAECVSIVLYNSYRGDSEWFIPGKELERKSVKLFNFRINLFSGTVERG